MVLLAFSRARTHALILAALLGAPAAAASGQKEAPRTTSASEGKANDRLPSGDSAELRVHLTDWSAPPELARKLVESLDPGRGAGQATKQLIVSSGFGWRTDPLRGGHRRHEGVDLPGRLGSDVHATGAGVVSFAGWANGYGKLIQINHPGGLRTRYAHLSQILVKPGAKVFRGETIGRIGSTGRSTGSHLHYEVRAEGTPVNPLAFMGAAPAGDVPRYDVEGAEPRTVTPHWVGWADDRSQLPEARIR